MSTKVNTRITIDLPNIEHKHLKMLCVMYGKSIKDVMRSYIEEDYNRLRKAERICTRSHEFNDETIKSLKKSKDNPNIACKDLADFFNRLNMSK